MNLRLFFSFLLAYGLGCLLLPQQGWGQCDRRSDSLELIKLYNATGGANWVNKWDLKKPMSGWYGVTLNTEGCVIKIELNKNKLNGSLPNFNLQKLTQLILYGNQLSGNIPNFNLPNLTYLNLFDNQLNGSIPNFNLPDLSELFLNKNQLSGGLPNFNLPNLTKLNLYSNQLSGNIPNFNLPNLEFLNVSINNLSGSIPDFNLPKLEYLILFTNSLNGNIPNFNLPNLTHLSLSFNQLNGNIPNLNLPNLNALELSYNNLSGSVPDFMMISLISLILNNNQLSGNVPNFKLPNLTNLQLHKNQLSLLPQFTSLDKIGTPNNSFDSLNFHRNRLSFDDILPNLSIINKAGKIARYAPQDSIYRDTTIRINEGQTLSVDLGIDSSVSDNRYTWFKNDQGYITLTGNNKLTFNAVKATDAGTYRVVVTNPQAPELTLYGRKVRIEVIAAAVACRTSDSLELVKLYNATNGPNWTNKWVLSTSIDKWYGVRLNTQGCVTCLDLDGNFDCLYQDIEKGNGLTGSIPDIYLPSLNVLVLGRNAITGTIPTLQLPSVELLALSFNKLTGNIPELQTPNIKQLRADHNQLSGNLPDFNFANIQYLALQNNLLSGQVPNLKLPKLQYLFLENNQLSGSIPDFNLPALQDLNLYNNKLTGNIPDFKLPSLRSLNLTSNQLTGNIPDLKLPYLNYLNIANNQLSGTIPNLDLPNLIDFTAQMNQLSGSIPAFKMPILQGLNLNSNQFTGQIPVFELPNLATLVLSNNKLSGLIPNFNLPNLTSLRLNNNKFTQFSLQTALSSLGAQPLGKSDSLSLQDNQITFDDILPNLSLIQKMGTQAKYAPQDSIYRDTTIRLSAGQPISIDLGIDASASDNRYTWFKNDQAYTTLTGNNKLTFNAVKTTDAGTYRVVVTNPQASELTLYGRKVRIEVSAAAAACRTSDSLELVKLYNATDGPNWTNKWDLGKPISGWYGVDLNAEGCVTCLDLDGDENCTPYGLTGNGLKGSIPNLKLPSLFRISLSQNQLSGSIPNLDLPNLVYFSASRNKLDGNIPDFNLPNLLILDLSINQLIGEIPNFNLPKLTGLYLTSNKLTGKVPNFNLPDLSVLELSINQLSGSIPNFNLPLLNSLGLALNNLNGSIPNFNMPKLGRLLLHGNQLSGNIPNFNYSNLVDLWLHNNQLSGTIPDFNLPNLKTLNLSFNQLSGSIPDFNQPNLVELVLNNNRLSGTLPNFNLPNLKILSLSVNRLNGNIPNFNLPNLTSLRLSNNKFSQFPSQTILSSLGTPPLGKFDSLSLQKNLITFDDILPNFSLIQKMGLQARYAPQDSIYRDTTINLKTGESLNLDLGIDASIPDNQYKWYKNGQVYGSTTNSNKLIINNFKSSDAGTYRVQVTNPKAPALTLYSKAIRLILSTNNCTSVANATLSSSATSDNICSGTSISLSASGGTSYRWSTGQSTSSINLSISQNQTVTVSITDAGGCSQSLSKSLVAINIPKAEISTPGTIICTGGKFTLSAPLVNGVQYQWLRDNISVQGPGLLSTYEATQAGSYTVQLSAFGCSNTSAPLNIIQSNSNPALKPNLSATRDSICPGDSVRISATSGLRYTWSTGSSSSVIVVKPIQSSTYAVTVADAGNCSSILRQTISLVAAPQARPSLSDLNCGFTLLAAGTGGRLPYRYRWSTGSTSSSVTVTKGGNYELLLVDARQCSAKASIVVDSFSFLTAAPILLDPNCGAVDGSITLQLDPKREPYQIEWSPRDEGQGDNPRTLLDAGTYQALILDKQGCMDTIEVTLNKQEDCDKDFLIYRSFSPNRDGVNEYFVIQAKRTGGCPSGDLNECYPNNELILFNRWGEAVYRKKGYTADWDADGYPGGVYFFLFYPDRDKPKGVIRGALTVLK